MNELDPRRRAPRWPTRAEAERLERERRIDDAEDGLHHGRNWGMGAPLPHVDAIVDFTTMRDWLRVNVQDLDIWRSGVSVRVLYRDDPWASAFIHGVLEAKKSRTVVSEPVCTSM